MTSAVCASVELRALSLTRIASILSSVGACVEPRGHALSGRNQVTGCFCWFGSENGASSTPAFGLLLAMIEG